MPWRKITRGKLSGGNPAFLRGRNNYLVQIFVGTLAPYPLPFIPLSIPLPRFSDFHPPAPALYVHGRFGQDLHKNNVEQQSLEQLPSYLAGHRPFPVERTATVLF